MGVRLFFFVVVFLSAGVSSYFLLEMQYGHVTKY